VFFYGERNPYGEFSQFYPSAFCDEQGNHYKWAEQWMMASKARLMGDLAILPLVMAANSPSEVKALGRRVKHWDQDKWDKHKYAIVCQGTRLKTTNKKVRKVLLGTGHASLAEASAKDRIWGIGVSVKDALQGKQWRGENLLGKALMQVRGELQSDQSPKWTPPWSSPPPSSSTSPPSTSPPS